MTNQESNEEKSSELNRQGYELAEAGRWQESITYYQEALHHDPRNVYALTNMGNAMLSLGRLTEALTYQDKALAVDPDNALAWANKAVILSSLNRRSDAIHCYERSIEKDPCNKVTWFNKGVALFLLGKKLEAIQSFDYILENIDARMKNAIRAKADILNEEGYPNEAAKCLERMKQIDAEGEPFSFASVQLDVNFFGKKVDGRKVLRGFEAALRKRTGLPQITAYFMPSERAFEPMQLEYSSNHGYRVYLQVGSFFSGDANNAENEIVELIQNHARKFGIRPTPPPIPDTDTSVQQDINFDVLANHYDALAHDGGCLVAFYREKQGDKGWLLRHVPPLGFVHYRFLFKPDYKQLLRDSAKHCSDFLDLSYLDGEAISEKTLQTFLRENKLYGWETKEF